MRLPIRALSTLIGLAAGFAAGPVLADTIVFNSFVQSPHETVSLSSPRNIPVADAGEFRVTINGNAVNAFCVEVERDATFGTPFTNYTAQGSGYSGTQLDRVSRLYEQFLGVSRQSAVNSAAFQTAVWELTYDGAGPLNLGSGTFQAGGTQAATVAASWLNQLDSGATGSWQFTRYTSPTNQAIVVASCNGADSSGLTSCTATSGGGGGGGAVPIPATAALLSLGLVGIAGVRRRR